MIFSAANIKRISSETTVTVFKKSIKHSSLHNFHDFLSSQTETKREKKRIKLKQNTSEN
jgi:hypothetical protein